jgi:RNA polymerase sigma factor (sigma-70 family)
VRQRARHKTATEELPTGRLLHFKPPEQRTPEDVLLEKERQQIAAEALARLSERDQECLALRRSGLTNQQVAEALQVNAVTVRQIISRALRRFEQLYDQLLAQTASASTSKKANGSTYRETERR